MTIFKKKQTLFNSTENCCPEVAANNVVNLRLLDNNNLELILNDGTTHTVNLDRYDDRWEYPTPSLQSFIHSSHIDTEALLINKLTGYFIQVMGEVTITQANINVTATGASPSTDILFGIYTVDNGYPKTLLCKTPVLSTSATGVQNATIVGGYQILTKGIYFVAYSSNSDATLLAISKQTPIHLPGHLNTLDSSSFITGLSANYNYTGTLPTTFPAGGSGLYADIPMAIFKI